MNPAGNNCGACQNNIVLEKEGTWCPDCLMPFHKSCISSEHICKGCNIKWRDPSESFVYSATCPECLNTLDRAEQCNLCGAWTRWDTEEDFIKFLSHRERQLDQLRNTGVILAPSGAIVILMAVGMIYLFFTGRLPVLIAPGVTGLVGFVLLGSGISKILTSNQLKQFR